MINNTNVDSGSNMAKNLNKIGEVVNRGNQTLPLPGVGVRGGAWRLVGRFVQHGGVVLCERDSRGGPGLDFLLSLKSVESICKMFLKSEKKEKGWLSESYPNSGPLDVSESSEPLGSVRVRRIGSVLVHQGRHLQVHKETKWCTFLFFFLKTLILITNYNCPLKLFTAIY